MKSNFSHITDDLLLRSMEGELTAGQRKLVLAHLDECWQCRARSQSLQESISSYVGVHQLELDADLPPIDGPRSLLKARMNEIARTESVSSWNNFRNRLALAMAVCGVFAAGLFVAHWTGGPGRQLFARPRTVFYIPDSSLTPGATLISTRQRVCAQANTKNKAVSRAIQRKVFEEYGIVGADPRAYEIDYLVTPALGGADDIRNLWPHSYSETVWNAEVKDALEDRLRDLVCDGGLDLSQAQQEIAGNWIASYKKRFHTDSPLTGR